MRITFSHSALASWLKYLNRSLIISYPIWKYYHCYNVRTSINWSHHTCSKQSFSLFAFVITAYIVVTSTTRYPTSVSTFHTHDTHTHTCVTHNDTHTWYTQWQLTHTHTQWHTHTHIYNDIYITHTHNDTHTLLFTQDWWKGENGFPQTAQLTMLPPDTINSLHLSK